MHQNCIKYILVLTILLFPAISFASKVPGYIITNSMDTLYGEVKIYKTNPTTSGLVIIGVDLEQFNSLVSFREAKKKRFVRYYPEDISGFGFLYKTSNYRFNQFEIISKSFLKSDREYYRFLNLIYEGEICLYHDIVRKPNPAYTNSGLMVESTIIDNIYYLYSEEKGLVRFEKSRKYETVIDILAYFEVDSEFLKNISPQRKFMEIIQILEEYHKWKSGKEQLTFL